MDNYTINYEILYLKKYSQNVINIKIIYQNYIVFTLETLYANFYEKFVQNYNPNYYYCELSKYCELEIEEVINYGINYGKIIHFIIINKINDDGIINTNRSIFSVKMNDTFYSFLETLKQNHSKVVRNSKW